LVGSHRDSRGGLFNALSHADNTPHLHDYLGRNPYLTSAARLR